MHACCASPVQGVGEGNQIDPAVVAGAAIRTVGATEDGAEAGVAPTSETETGGEHFAACSPRGADPVPSEDTPPPLSLLIILQNRNSVQLPAGYTVAGELRAEKILHESTGVSIAAQILVSAGSPRTIVFLGCGGTPPRRNTGKPQIPMDLAAFFERNTAQLPDEEYTLGCRATDELHAGQIKHESTGVSIVAPIFLSADFPRTVVFHYTTQQVLRRIQAAAAADSSEVWRLLAIFCRQRAQLVTSRDPGGYSSRAELDEHLKEQWAIDRAPGSDDDVVVLPIWTCVENLHHRNVTSFGRPDKCLYSLVESTRNPAARDYEDWWQGTLVSVSSKSGHFPKKFVEESDGSAAPPAAPGVAAAGVPAGKVVKAVADFGVAEGAQDGDLHFKTGDEITVTDDKADNLANWTAFLANSHQSNAVPLPLHGSCQTAPICQKSEDRAFVCKYTLVGDGSSVEGEPTVYVTRAINYARPQHARTLLYHYTDLHAARIITNSEPVLSCTGSSCRRSRPEGTETSPVPAKLFISSEGEFNRGTPCIHATKNYPGRFRSLEEIANNNYGSKKHRESKYGDCLLNKTKAAIPMWVEVNDIRVIKLPCDSHSLEPREDVWFFLGGTTVQEGTGRPICVERLIEKTQANIGFRAAT
jgi:hypothetical protein